MKLKPCPFCLSENVNTSSRASTYFFSKDVLVDGYVKCYTCGARGPLLRRPYSLTQLINSWNARAPITLELKFRNDDTYRWRTEPFEICDVKDVGRDNIQSDHFFVEAPDRKLLKIEFFEYVKNADTGAMYVKDGKWVFVGE